MTIKNLRINLFKNKNRLSIIVLAILAILLIFLILWNKSTPEMSSRQSLELPGGIVVLENISDEEVNQYLFYVTVFICTLLAAALSFKNFEDRKKNYIFAVLLFLSVISCLLTFYRHGLTREKYFDIGDMYHYYLGPKYFVELGYEDLYTCSLAAQSEIGRQLSTYTRDLKTNKVFSIKKNFIKDAKKYCRENFSVARWQDFKQDVDVFRDWHDEDGWQRRLVDHGYNGTPVFNFFASIISNHVEINHLNLTVISLINLVMVFSMFIFVIMAFGWEVGLFFIIFFCINSPDRYLLGGAFLRYFWLFALVGGLSFFKLKKYKISAILLSLSGMLIVFPVFFFAGVLLKSIINKIQKRKNPLFYKKFLTTALLTFALLFSLSVSSGQGIKNWSGFAHQMEVNSGRLASGRIGFIYNFIYPKEVTKKQLNYEFRLESFQKKNYLYFSWENVYWLLIFLIIALQVKIAPRISDLNFTILLGFSLFFLLLSTVRYYYAEIGILLLLWGGSENKRAANMFSLFLFLIMAIAFLLEKNTLHAFVHNTYLSFALTAYLLSLLFYFFKTKSNKFNLNK